MQMPAIVIPSVMRTVETHVLLRQNMRNPTATLYKTEIKKTIAWPWWAMRKAIATASALAMEEMLAWQNFK